MEERLEDLFKGYDFGYDLDLISAEQWNKEILHCYRKIYLQKTDWNGQPLPAYFHAYFNKNGDVREIVVEMI